MKTKGIAAWSALLFGSLGLHRAYLYGLRDRWLWFYPWPTLFGLVALRRFEAVGPDDAWATWGLPVLGVMLAQGGLTAIVIALTSDERWNARHNPGQAAPDARWAPILAAIAGLLCGGASLMSAIVFAAQRYFELSLGK
jgi:hypothetical protein